MTSKGILLILSLLAYIVRHVSQKTEEQIHINIQYQEGEEVPLSQNQAGEKMKMSGTEYLARDYRKGDAVFPPFFPLPHNFFRGVKGSFTPYAFMSTKGQCINAHRRDFILQF